MFEFILAIVVWLLVVAGFIRIWYMIKSIPAKYDDMMKKYEELKEIKEIKEGFLKDK